MELTPINAETAPRPRAGYAQALAVKGAQRLLFISGQVPETADGQVPADFVAQAELAWANVLAQLEAAGMTLDNLVKVRYRA